MPLTDIFRSPAAPPPSNPPGPTTMSFKDNVDALDKAVAIVQAAKAALDAASAQRDRAQAEYAKATAAAREIYDSLHTVLKDILPGSAPQNFRP